MMVENRRIFWLALAVVALGVLGLALWPSVREELAPDPVAAWVAVEVEGTETAVVGPVEMEAGTPFRLHAVLEAETRDGGRVYYTEAPALRFVGEAAGGQVPAAALRAWDRSAPVKVLWFTVEGAVPYLKLDPAAQATSLAERFRIIEFFHPDWPQTWSIPVNLEPAHHDALTRRGGESGGFGTQRFHARIEIYSKDNTLVPAQRFSSWSADDLRRDAEKFPGVVATLPGALGAASSFFGLTQIEPGAAPGRELVGEISRLTARRLAFSRLTLLAAVLEAADRDAEDLEWLRVSIDGSFGWKSEDDRGADPSVAPGDLLQVGDRFVLLYRDSGAPGRLDREDLCFDVVQGAEVRMLSEVFTGDGEVEWARL